MFRSRLGRAVVFAAAACALPDFAQADVQIDVRATPYGMLLYLPAPEVARTRSLNLGVSISVVDLQQIAIGNPQQPLLETWGICGVCGHMRRAEELHQPGVAQIHHVDDL